MFKTSRATRLQRMSRLGSGLFPAAPNCVGPF
jgi:hypothetical protein